VDLSLVKSFTAASKIKGRPHRDPYFDKIVVDAKRRHKAFFEKLGIG
jgi:hypothetical protein